MGRGREGGGRRRRGRRKGGGRAKGEKDGRKGVAEQTNASLLRRASLSSCVWLCLSACMSVCQFVCLLVFLCLCLPLSVCLSVCLSPFLPSSFLLLAPPALVSCPSVPRPRLSPPLPECRPFWDFFWSLRASWSRCIAGVAWDKWGPTSPRTQKSWWGF